MELQFKNKVVQVDNGVSYKIENDQTKRNVSLFEANGGLIILLEREGDENTTQHINLSKASVFLLLHALIDKLDGEFGEQCQAAFDDINTTIQQTIFTNEQGATDGK